jgi:ATP phosphoribosyltransferase
VNGLYSLTVAVSKGRVLADVEAVWRESGWAWPEADRQLWFPPHEDRPGLVIARNSDIPKLVQRGIAAFGIVGSDVLEEQADADILEVLDLGIAPCRMVLASLDGKWPEGPARVASKYPGVTHRYFRLKSHPIEVVGLSGSLELAPHIGLAPYIVDVVQTGRTLRQHHLKEIDTLFHSTARLVANPAAWRWGHESEQIYEKFRHAIRTGSNAAPVGGVR